MAFKKNQKLWLAEYKHGQYEVIEAKFVEQDGDDRFYVAYTIDFEGKPERCVNSRRADQIFTTYKSALVEAIRKCHLSAQSSLARAIELAALLIAPEKAADKPAEPEPGK